MVSASRPHPPSGRQVDEQATRTVVAEPSTTLKWSSDGELSALDLHRIIDRLADADPVASSLSVSQFGMVSR